MKALSRLLAVTACGVAIHAAAPACTQELAPRAPFTATLSNNTPLAFGMDADTASRALGVPLTYVRGKPGDELFMVVQPVNGDGFMWRADPLYLQFRKGRLTGWKGDWSRGWLWRSPFG